MPNCSNKSDHEIISLIAINDLQGWGHLYDKYSSSMYGIIYVLSKRKDIADEILMQLFLNLKKDEALNSLPIGLCSYLMNNTFAFSLQALRQRGVAPDMQVLGNAPRLIHLLCAKNYLPKDESTQHAELNICLSRNDNHYWVPVFGKEIPNDLLPVYNIANKILKDF